MLRRRHQCALHTHTHTTISTLRCVTNCLFTSVSIKRSSELDLLPFIAYPNLTGYGPRHVFRLIKENVVIREQCNQTSESKTMNLGNNAAGIERLTDSNFETWKVQIKSVLVFNDLWGYVSGVIPKPTEAEKIAEWAVKDAKALALITLSVKENQISYIRKAETSKAAWESLQKVHESQGPTRKVMLYKQLFQLSKKQEESMSEHLRNFQQKLDQLEATGIEIPTELSSIMLLNSLPDNYKKFLHCHRNTGFSAVCGNIKNKIIGGRNPS